MGDTLRILGIDPGSRKTGFGVVNLVDDRVQYVASGAIKTQDGEFPDRLREIYQAVSALAAEYAPDVVSIESVFMHKNAGSALKLGQARAAALCATFELDAEICEYTPREVKQAIVGTGGASKEQVQHMVVSLLSLSATPQEDAADALAVALCHCHQRKVSGALLRHVVGLQ